MPTHVERVLRSLASEPRLAILDVMVQGATSPVQVSRRLGMPLGQVAYHVRALRDAGLLRMVAQRPARGAIENLYEVSDLGRRAYRAVAALVDAIED